MVSVFLVIVAIVATTLATEILLHLSRTFFHFPRLTQISSVSDVFCAVRPLPGRYQLAHGKWKTVNSAGFISTPEIDIKKQSNTLRLVFFGGSSTAGTGFDLADEETWPWKVREKIQQSQKDKAVDFIDAGFSGYTSFNSLGIFLRYVRFYQPDLLIFDHGWNEMYYFQKADNILSWANGKKPSPKETLFDFFHRYSVVFQLIKPFFTHRQTGEYGSAVPSAQLLESFPPEGIHIFKENLLLFKEAARVLGIPLLVAKQPTLITDGISPEVRKRCRYYLHGATHAAHVKAFREIYQVIDETVPNENIIDLTSLSGRSEFFADHIHPTVEGSEAIATLVAQSVNRYLDHR